MSGKLPLTLKQKNFCAYFVEIGSATAAYEKAYNSKSKKNAHIMASHNMAKPAIQQEIARLTGKLELKQAATLEEVHSFWAKVLRGEDEEATVRDKIKVSELIAKTKGAFIDRVEHSGEIGVNIQVNLNRESTLIYKGKG